MTARQLNLALAVVFLIVGILATANTLRLNNYIRETLPRDLQQEQCNTDTIKVLTQWLEIRKIRDKSMDIRDEAGIDAIDSQLTTGQVDPQKLAAWREAVAQDRQVRVDADRQSDTLPKC